MGALAVLAAVSSAASIYAAQQQYSATKNQGRLAENQANIQASQIEDQAIAERGMAAMNAKEQRRQGTLMQSKAIAAAAAAGRSPSIDKGASDIIGDINAETEYSALTSLLEGRVKASNLQMEASTMRTQGSIARKSADKMARAGLISNIGSNIGLIGSTFGQKYGSFNTTNATKTT